LLTVVSVFLKTTKMTLEDELEGYVRPLLQLETVTSVLVIRSDKQFCVQITTEQ